MSVERVSLRRAVKRPVDYAPQLFENFIVHRRNKEHSNAKSNVLQNPKQKSAVLAPSVLTPKKEVKKTSLQFEAGPSSLSLPGQPINGPAAFSPIAANFDEEKLLQDLVQQYFTPDRKRKFGVAADGRYYVYTEEQRQLYLWDKETATITKRNGTTRVRLVDEMPADRKNSVRAQSREATIAAATKTINKDSSSQGKLQPSDEVDGSARKVRFGRKPKIRPISPLESNDPFSGSDNGDANDVRHTFIGDSKDFSTPTKQPPRTPPRSALKKPQISTLNLKTAAQESRSPVYIKLDSRAEEEDDYDEPSESAEAGAETDSASLSPPPCPREQLLMAQRNAIENADSLSEEDREYLLEMAESTRWDHGIDRRFLQRHAVAAPRLEKVPTSVFNTPPSSSTSSDDDERKQESSDLKSDTEGMNLGLESLGAKIAAINRFAWGLASPLSVANNIKKDNDANKKVSNRKRQASDEIDGDECERQQMYTPKLFLADKNNKSSSSSSPGSASKKQRRTLLLIN